MGEKLFAQRLAVRLDLNQVSNLYKPSKIKLL